MSRPTPEEVRLYEHLYDRIHVVLEDVDTDDALVVLMSMVTDRINASDTPDRWTRHIITRLFMLWEMATNHQGEDEDEDEEEKITMQ